MNGKEKRYEIVKRSAREASLMNALNPEGAPTDISLWGDGSPLPRSTAQTFVSAQSKESKQSGAKTHPGHIGKTK